LCYFISALDFHAGICHCPQIWTLIQSLLCFWGSETSMDKEGRGVAWAWVSYAVIPGSRVQGLAKWIF
jgi:hypothetical protein